DYGDRSIGEDRDRVCTNHGRLESGRRHALHQELAPPRGDGRPYGGRRRARSRNSADPPGLTGEDIREALQYSAEARRVGELRAEIEADLAAANAYEAEHGSFADLAREHYSSSDDDAI